MSRPLTTNRVSLRIINEYSLDTNDPRLGEKVKEKLDAEFEQWLEDHDDEAVKWGQMATEYERSLKFSKDDKDCEESDE